MLSSKMEKALNKQLNAELASSYLYLSMAAYFESENLEGCAGWMRVQAQEENLHGMKFYDFIHSRGGRVTLTAIEGPKTEWESVIDGFDGALAHEKKITKSINDLVNLALEEKDNATHQFLMWFVAEQVEEEDTVGKIIQNLKMVAGAPGGMFLIDRELGQRTAVEAGGE